MSSSFLFFFLNYTLPFSPILNSLLWGISNRVLIVTVIDCLNYCYKIRSNIEGSREERMVEREITEPREVFKKYRILEKEEEHPNFDLLWTDIPRCMFYLCVVLWEVTVLSMTIFTQILGNVYLISFPPQFSLSLFTMVEKIFFWFESFKGVMESDKQQTVTQVIEPIPAIQENQRDPGFWFQARHHSCRLNHLKVNQ